MADRWQAPLALTAISSVLCNLQPDLFPIGAAYTLLQNSAAFAPVKARASTSLLSIFGDATAVATSPPLLGHFLSLPHSAVLVLLQSDRLVTDAEATVLLLLSEWCDGAQGRACSEKQLQKLNRHIRYSRLSKHYLTDLFEGLHTPSLTTKQRMELLHFQSFPEDGQRLLDQLDSLNNPAGWYLPSRTSASEGGEATLRVTMNIPEAEVYRFVSAIKAMKNGGPPPQAISSTPLYAQGFWWTLQLSGVDGDPWCGLKVHGMSSLLSGSLRQELQHGVMCDFRIFLVGRTSEHDMPHFAKTMCPVGSEGMGADIDEVDEKLQCGPLEARWWRQFVVDGCIRIVASVSHVC